MAKSCANLTLGNGGGSGTSTNTASVSPAANSVVMVAVHSFGTTTMSLSGNGLTYTLVRDDDTENGFHTWIFRAAGASPSSGAITLTHDNGATVGWVVDNITGTPDLANPVTSNHAHAGGTSSSPAVTLSAFAKPQNGVWAYTQWDDVATHTPGDGFSEVSEGTGGAFGLRVATQFRDSNDTSVTATLSQSENWDISAVEIADGNWPHRHKRYGWEQF